MLSRIGNSLFWMGRYIERAEHIARHARVQYASSVDAPLSQKREAVLESILDMATNREGYFNVHSQLNEDDVVRYTAVSETNNFSVLAYISMIRENARGARDSLSIELWEAINSFYHKINAFSTAGFQAEEIEYFARRIEQNSYVIKGYIDNTLLHNAVWMLISLGIHLERATQVILILQTKLKDIEKNNSSKFEEAVDNFQWTTVLRSIEAYDMFMRCKKTTPNKHHVLDFLLFDTAFPKSIAFSLSCVKQFISSIPFPDEEKKKESLEFIAGKLACRFQYTTIDEVEEKASEFLKQTLNTIYEIAGLLDVKYLKYH
ncbi:alpha-E domain-containing protein [Adhaeribacter aquaticus]|uniref:alpha-E domain-containing protein n=1 Tax=Adhaeribacter aquaticus TaxID=299567 RepID=UPI0004788CD2|nr:alpha-E domain-containing protein [Adhaeribacter aquaticus]